MSPREPLGIEEAERISRAVLERHSIAITDKGALAVIADGLGIASDRVSLFDQRHWVEERARTANKIEALKALSALYNDPRGRPFFLERYWRSEAHRLMHEKFGKDLDSVIEGIAALLEVEQHIRDTLPVVKIANKRPTSAKSDGAACIFEILSENGVEAWKACGAIADMLIDAGIEDRDVDKVKRSLYDKLTRVR